jgi:5-methylcytosine-specific restriction protein A
LSAWIPIEKNEPHVKKEREKARTLRESGWWKQQCAQGRCHYCYQSFPPETLTMDHQVPIARGGYSNKKNCVPACKSCNAAKKAQTPAEMILNRLKSENRS